MSLTTSRRSWIKSLVAIVCAACVPVAKACAPAAMSLAERYSPPHGFLVTAAAGVDAINAKGIPAIGEMFPLQIRQAEPVWLTLVSKTVEPVWQTRLGQPTQWLVTCEWKILPDKQLTTPTRFA